MHPTAHNSIFPVEILDHIFQHFVHRELPTILIVNRTFYNIATRCLYHTIQLKEDQPQRCIQCLRALSRNSALPPIVRELSINWSNWIPTKNLYLLLHTILRRVTNLTFLTLEFPKCHYPLWIVDGCSFKLRHFETTIDQRSSLAKFLDTQPKITELTLRGFHNQGSSILLNLDPALMSESLSLSPESLPDLRDFSAIHAGPSVIASVVKGRPIYSVSIPIYPLCMSETFDALLLASKPLKRLSVISFDTSDPTLLFSEAVKRYPLLEGLHIVTVTGEYSERLLRDTGSVLSGFKYLRYLTFMARPSEFSVKIDERSIAQHWHQCCPSLQTIILPEGKVWFDGGSNWACMLD